MIIQRNMLVQWHDRPLAHYGPPHVERVLWVNRDRTMVAVIDIFDNGAWPRLCTLGEIVDAIDGGDAHELVKDPYDSIIPVGPAVTRKARLAQRRSFDAIRPLREDTSGALFAGRTRGPMVRDAVERCQDNGMPRDRLSIEKDLRRWWQRGLRIDALIPDLHKCGGAGKTRDCKDDSKRGPKNQYGREPGSRTPLTEPTHLGINITPRDAELILKGLRKHYETKDKKTGRPPAFTVACDRVLAEFFNDGVELINGQWEPIQRPVHLTPTDRQMQYWYRRMRHPVDAFKGREGEREFDLSGRELMGEESVLDMWPGKQMQIDPTRPPIILVSDLDPTEELGSPTLYIGKDVDIVPSSGGLSEGIDGTTARRVEDLGEAIITACG